FNKPTGFFTLAVGKIFVTFPLFKSINFVVREEVVSVGYILCFRTYNFIKTIFCRPSWMIFKICIQMPFTYYSSVIARFRKGLVYRNIFSRIQIAGGITRKEIGYTHPCRILS